MKINNMSKGFTLMELMITLAIVGIISAVAFPSYQDSVRKSRRSQGHGGLVQMQLEQENFRMINTAYANAFGVGSNDVKQPTNDYYTFTMSGTSATAYLLKATAKSGQEKDTACKEITLNQAGDKLPTACW